MLVAKTCDGLSLVLATAVTYARAASRAYMNAVPNGEGKGWSKGRSAANDQRIARNAAAHRGKTYKRWLSDSQDHRMFAGSARTLPATWSDEMAYVVGLTATDGCLYTGLRKINFKSSDRELVETYLRLLGRTNPVKRQKTRKGGIVYFAEFGDTELYRWFQSIGLTPRKSLTLGGFNMPDAFLAPLLRGLFDGDGSLENFVGRPTVRTYPNYTYERLHVCFNSASRAHLEWIQARVKDVYELNGRIEQLPKVEGKHDFFRLKYGKLASIPLLRIMYPNDDVPKLERKWAKWNDYRRRHELK